jgi:hypothetical protein
MKQHESPAIIKPAPHTARGILKGEAHFIAFATLFVAFLGTVGGGIIIVATLVLMPTVAHFAGQVLTDNPDIIGLKSVMGIVPTMTAVLGCALGAYLAVMATKVAVNAIWSLRILDADGEPVKGVVVNFPFSGKQIKWDEKK